MVSAIQASRRIATKSTKTFAIAARRKPAVSIGKMLNRSSSMTLSTNVLIARGLHHQSAAAPR